MKNVSEKALLHLWNFCIDSTDTLKEARDEFGRHIDKLLAKGEVEYNVAMNFIKKNTMKDLSNDEKVSKKRSTRARTVSDNGPLMPSDRGNMCGFSTSSCGYSNSPRYIAPHRYTSCGSSPIAPHRYTSCGSSPRSC